MKKQLVILFLLALIVRASAQSSTFKAGANFNADIASHKLGEINCPSWEISFERALGKKFSINGTFNYTKCHYEVTNDFDLLLSPGTYSGATGFTNYDQTLILEGRYYLNSNTTGIYFQLGIPFTYSTEKRFYTSPSGQGSVSLTPDRCFPVFNT